MQHSYPVNHRKPYLKEVVVMEPGKTAPASISPQTEQKILRSFRTKTSENPGKGDVPVLHGFKTIYWKEAEKRVSEKNILRKNQRNRVKARQKKDRKTAYRILMTICFISILFISVFTHRMDSKVQVPASPGIFQGFKAINDAGTARFLWSDVDGLPCTFEVMKSEDGINFSHVMKVEKIPGIMATYQTTAGIPAHYYRLLRHLPSGITQKSDIMNMIPS